MARGWSLQPDGTMVRVVHCTTCGYLNGYLNVLREGADLEHLGPCWACVKDLPPWREGA